MTVTNGHIFKSAFSSERAFPLLSLQISKYYNHYQIGEFPLLVFAQRYQTKSFITFESKMSLPFLSTLFVNRRNLLWYDLFVNCRKKCRGKNTLDFPFERLILFSLFIQVCEIWDERTVRPAQPASYLYSVLIRKIFTCKENIEIKWAAGPEFYQGKYLVLSEKKLDSGNIFKLFMLFDYWLSITLSVWALNHFAYSPVWSCSDYRCNHQTFVVTKQLSHKTFDFIPRCHGSII